MRSFCSVVALFVFFSVITQAQSDPAHKVTKDRYNWSGFYAGVDVASANTNFDATTSTVYNSTGYFNMGTVNAINALGQQSLDSKIFSGGGQVGYDFQHRKYVYGVEADFDSFLTGKFVQNSEVLCCTGITQSEIFSQQNIDTDWLFMQRARVGYVFNKRTLLYGTGGLAETDVTYGSNFGIFNLSSGGFSGGANEGGYSAANKLGWVGGGGIESALTRHLSVRPEILYLDIAPVSNAGSILYSYNGVSNQTWPQNPFKNTANLHSEIFRFELNYKFNGFSFKKSHK